MSRRGATIDDVRGQVVAAPPRRPGRTGRVIARLLFGGVFAILAVGGQYEVHASRVDEAKYLAAPACAPGQTEGCRGWLSATVTAVVNHGPTSSGETHTPAQMEIDMKTA